MTEPLLVAEPIVGWKQARLCNCPPEVCPGGFYATGRHDVHYLPEDEARCLRSAYGLAGWGPTPLDMVLSDPDDTAPAHDAPDEQCGCGFYALRDRRSINRLWAAGDPHLVTIQVELTGRVIEHARGYRAQRQKVTAIWLHPGQVLPASVYLGREGLVARYGVDVHEVAPPPHIDIDATRCEQIHIEVEASPPDWLSPYQVVASHQPPPRTLLTVVTSDPGLASQLGALMRKPLPLRVTIGDRVALCEGETVNWTTEGDLDRTRTTVQIQVCGPLTMQPADA